MAIHVSRKTVPHRSTYTSHSVLGESGCRTAKKSLFSEGTNSLIAMEATHVSSADAGGLTR